MKTTKHRWLIIAHAILICHCVIFGCSRASEESTSAKRVIPQKELPQGTLVYQRDDGIYSQSLDKPRKAKRIVKEGTHAVWSKDGTQLACITATGIRLGSASETPVEILPLKQARAICFSADGSALFIATQNTLIRFHIPSREQIELYRGKPLYELSAHPNGQWILATTKNCAINSSPSP